MTLDEKLVWYLFDLHVSHPRSETSYASKHLNQCATASLQEIEISEETNDQGLTKTFVSAFIQCTHHWCSEFEGSSYGSRDGLSLSADMLIRD